MVRNVRVDSAARNSDVSKRRCGSGRMHEPREHRASLIMVVVILVVMMLFVLMPVMMVRVAIIAHIKLVNHWKRTGRRPGRPLR